MARIIDDRIFRGKQNRNEKIRRYFEKRWLEGIRWEIIESEIILEWGVSSSTINKIMKKYGDYK